MIDIGNNIYCIKRKLYQGQASGEPTVLARHLLEGVFKKEYLLKCTFSGQSPRAQGEERKNEKFMALNAKAKMEIISNYLIYLFLNCGNFYLFCLCIEYCLSFAKKEGWTKKQKNGETCPHTWTDIQRSISQKLGEMKREYKKNIEKK